jgi:hypothetical protein
LKTTLHRKRIASHAIAPGSHAGASAGLDLAGDSARAAVLLYLPLRLRILAALLEPDSATGLARRMKLPRQSVNYHLSELNDALVWFTSKGVPGKIEVQAWLSAIGLPQFTVDRFAADWQARLKQIFPN